MHLEPASRKMRRGSIERLSTVMGRVGFAADRMEMKCERRRGKTRDRMRDRDNRIIRARRNQLALMSIERRDIAMRFG